MLAAIVLAHFLAVGFKGSTPSLENEFNARLAHVSLGSRAFAKAVKAKLNKYGGRIEWDPTCGPTPIRMAYVQVHFDDTWSSGRFCFWSSGEGTRAQLLDSLEPDHLTQRTKDIEPLDFIATAYRHGNELIRCGRATGGVNYKWPTACVYRLKGNNWDLTSEKEGSAETWEGLQFAKVEGKIRPNLMHVTVRPYPDHLSTYHQGPHINIHETWQIIKGEIHRTGYQICTNALWKLDQLASFAQSNQHSPFDACVPAKWRLVLWDALRGPAGLHWDRVHDEAIATSYVIWDDPNQQHLSVHFSLKGGRWHVDQVKVIDHSV